MGSFLLKGPGKIFRPELLKLGYRNSTYAEFNESSICNGKFDYNDLFHEPPWDGSLN